MQPWRTLRSLAIVASILLALTCLGCGPTNGGDTPEKQGSLDQMKSVSFLFPGEEPADWHVVRPVIDEASFLHVGASLDFRWVARVEYSQRVAVIGSAGDAPDAFVCAQPQRFYPDFRRLALSGEIADISETFPEHAPALYNKFSSVDLSFAEVDGSVFAVPSLLPKATATSIVVDRVLFSKYGLAEIRTLDDYEDFLRVIKNNEDKVPGTISGLPSTLDLFARVLGYAVFDHQLGLVYRWDDPDMTIVPWEQTPEFIQIVQRLVSWYDEGLLVARANHEDTASFVYHGDYFAGASNSNGVSSSAGASEDGADALQNPHVFVLSPDMPIQRDSPMGRFHHNGAFVFSAGSPNAVTALRFLDWVHLSRENYYLTVYGLEGVHYDTSRTGYPLPAVGVDYRDRRYYNWDGSWALRNLEFILPEPYHDWDPATDPRVLVAETTSYPPHGAVSFIPDQDLQAIADRRSLAIGRFDYNLVTGRIANSLDVDVLLNQLPPAETALIHSRAGAAGSRELARVRPRAAEPT